MKLGKVARLFSKDKSKPSKVDELLESMPTIASKDVDPIREPTWITKKEAREAKENFQKDVDKKFQETGVEDPNDMLLLAELDDIILGNKAGVAPSDEILGKGWEKSGLVDKKDNKAYILRFVGNEEDQDVFLRKYVDSYDNWALKKEEQILDWLSKTEEGKRFQLANFGQIITPLEDMSLMTKTSQPTQTELDIMRRLKSENTSDITLDDIDRYDFAIGGESKFPDLTGDGKVTQADILKGRGVFQEGGEATASQMNQLMGQQEVIPEPMPDSELVPDEQMEANYVDFVVNQALDPQEKEYLEKELESNDVLSMLFDKVVEVASEFSGEGSVDGPGTGVSDSIPARLSDGEFVFTAKAVQAIGVEKLEQLMEAAEADYDRRMTAYNGGVIETEEETVEQDAPSEQIVRQDIRVRKETVGNQATMQEEDELISDEIKKRMLNPNQTHVRS
jgi:hypothetical protein